MEAKQIFEQYYKCLLDAAHNPDIAKGLSRSINANKERRASVMQRFPDTVELGQQVRRIKEDAITHMDELVARAKASLEANRAKVYLANTADDALKIISGIVGSGKTIVSGKTLVSEEVGLRHYLESLGNEFWETDVAQFIQQLREEKPMHYVYPSLHVTREEVAKLLTDLLHKDIPIDIPVQVRTIREFLRSKYFKADFGISGANVLAADTGSIFLLENEGNIRMSTNVPPVHIALIGIEKIVPSMDNAFTVAQVIWRYAGFVAPLYVSIISGPSGTADIENVMIQGSSGPLELHVILLDNGRSNLAKDPILKEALYCIKCGTCLFECPIFQLTAGHYGGEAYFGGVGSILSAFVGGSLKEAAPISFTCLRCGCCTNVCPTSIDTSKLTAELRQRIVKGARS